MKLSSAIFLLFTVSAPFAAADWTVEFYERDDCQGKVVESHSNNKDTDNCVKLDSKLALNGAKFTADSKGQDDAVLTLYTSDNCERNDGGGRDSRCYKAPNGEWKGYSVAYQHH